MLLLVGIITPKSRHLYDTVGYTVYAHRLHPVLLKTPSLSLLFAFTPDIKTFNSTCLMKYVSSRSVSKFLCMHGLYCIPSQGKHCW